MNSRQRHTYPLQAKMIRNAHSYVIGAPANIYLEMRSNGAAPTNVLTFNGEELLLKVVKAYKRDDEGFDVIGSINTSNDDADRRRLLADTLYAGSIVVEPYTLNGIVSTAVLDLGSSQNGLSFHIALEKWYKLLRGFSSVGLTQPDGLRGTLTPTANSTYDGQLEIYSTEKHSFLYIPVNKTGGRTSRALQNVCMDPGTSVMVAGDVASSDTNFSGYVIEVNNS